MLLDEAEFDDAVRDALDDVPPELMSMLDNVAFFVVAEPGPEYADLDDGHDGSEGPGELLGIYEGTPLTERDLGWAGALPDRITLFRGPLLRMCADREHLLDEIAVTVVHEIAHHFGIDDERLHELGWG